jgi:hypothetical protein
VASQPNLSSSWKSQIVCLQKHYAVTDQVTRRKTKNHNKTLALDSFSNSQKKKLPGCRHWQFLTEAHDIREFLILNQAKISTPTFVFQSAACKPSDPLKLKLAMLAWIKLSKKSLSPAFVYFCTWKQHVPNGNSSTLFSTVKSGQSKIIISVILSTLLRKFSFSSFLKFFQILI